MDYLEPGQILANRYLIVERLGKGAFGQTYLAQDTQLYDQLCVVKRLQPTSTDSEHLKIAQRLFQEEAKSLYGLGNHERIPKLFAHINENQEFYLVQEFIEGHDLTQEISEGQTKDETEVVELLRSILEVLSFVHQHGVIHRDIKPANLIRRKQDHRIVIIDFGAVKTFSTLNSQEIRQPTVQIGTLGYRPQEQEDGYPEFASDIYAVGMIGIQCLTGVLPRQLIKDPQTREIVWRDRTSVSPQFAEILDQMIRKDYRQRYPSAQEALKALNNLNFIHTPLLYHLRRKKRFLPLAILLVIPLFFFTKNFSIPSSNTTEEPLIPAPIPTCESAENLPLKEYTDSNFIIYYPDPWQPSPQSLGINPIAYFSTIPVSKEKPSRFSIERTITGDPTYTLEQLFKDTMQYPETQGYQLDVNGTENIIFQGSPAQKLSFSKEDWKMQIIIFIKDSIPYEIIYEAPEAEFQDLACTVEIMLENLKVN